VIAKRGDTHMKRWHAQISKRRGKIIAKTALSRKILVTAWAMMRDSTNYHDQDQPDSDNSNTTLYKNKVKDLEKRSQNDQRTTSIWEALNLLATDQKLRAELGLRRILPPAPTRHTK
jgi:hypothetical protein